MPVLRTILICLLSLVGVGAIVVVMLQKSDDDGIAGLAGTRSDSMRQNQGRGLMAKLPKLTVILGVLLGILSISLVLVENFS